MMVSVGGQPAVNLAIRHPLNQQGREILAGRPEEVGRYKPISTDVLIHDICRTMDTLALSSTSTFQGRHNAGNALPSRRPTPEAHQLPQQVRTLMMLAWGQENYLITAFSMFTSETENRLKRTLLTDKRMPEHTVLEDQSSRYVRRPNPAPRQHPKNVSR